MSNEFKIYQEGDRQIIERLIYPRFRGVITFNNATSDLEDMELLDKCTDALEVAKAMREA